MAEEFHSTGGGGACSTMSCCWWDTNCTTFAAAAAPPQPFLRSTPTAVRDLGRIDQLITNGNQPFFDYRPIETVDSLLNPLKEAFLPGFFEPAEPTKVSNYDRYDDHHDQSLQYSSSWAKFNPQFLEVPSVIPNLQQPSLFCNNSASPDQLWQPPANSTPTQSVEPNPCMKNKDHIGSEPPSSKKPRIGMLSPLPSFKVRKEKLGDRVTALQQLVSPFGKTDTASVLHEAIEYIKFLHDQVGQVLISPYLQQSLDSRNKNNFGRTTDDEEVTMNADLRSRGLCLVPISSAFAFASECSMDFWAPNYGGSYI